MENITDKAIQRDKETEAIAKNLEVINQSLKQLIFVMVDRKNQGLHHTANPWIEQQIKEAYKFIKIANKLLDKERVILARYKFKEDLSKFIFGTVDKLFRLVRRG